MLSARKTAVLLVDNKFRDLMVAALIAHQLEKEGVDCHLEPLEGWRGSLAAHRPDIIIFNHLTANHLVAYSHRLAKMGVVCAVLPNEGILYDRNVMDYNAGKSHNDAHIDLFFCWNEAHKEALLRCGYDRNTQIEVIGVPRFDFYFEPWSSIFEKMPRPSSRPQILFCTNFVFAKFFDLPKETALSYFRDWIHIPSYADYWGLVEANHASRGLCFGFLNALAASREFDVILRPHPNEPPAIYTDWLASLPEDQRERFRFDRTSNISQLIVNCDLEIACETCTTSLESWVAKKPTIELVLKKHPVFFHANIANFNATCERPDDLVQLVKNELKGSNTPARDAARKAHLQTWCNLPVGRAAADLARVVARKLENRPSPDWSQLTLTDHRRGAKLKFFQGLGLPYHFDPLLPIKKRMLGGRYVIRSQSYRKSITPEDVAQARQRMARLSAGAPSGQPKPA